MLAAVFGGSTTAVALWVGVMVGGFTLAVVASRRALGHATDLVAATGLPPFVVGITLLAVGTDLPEIANSIVSSISGHGDINVGDSIGSAATQSTLVLGLLPLLGGAFVVLRRQVLGIGIVTVGTLTLGAMLMGDGLLTRAEAALLLAAFVGGAGITWAVAPVTPAEEAPASSVRRWRSVVLALGSLAVVGVGALAAVWALTNLAQRLDAPEYVLAFFAASLGTSLPELVVDVAAVRQGRTEMAVGDALGSSFVDSTLSVAAGPLIVPITVSSSFVVRGSLAAAVAIALVVAVLAVRRRHDLRSGAVLLAIYLAFYVVIIGA